MTLNARVCLERQAGQGVTFSVGSYLRAGAGPLPAPEFKAYRTCVFIPWAERLPGQGAYLIPLGE